VRAQHTLTARPPDRATDLTPVTQTILDGVAVDTSSGTEQVITVNRTRGYHARITLWRKADTGWVIRRQSSNGRIGYGGLVAPDQRVQGSGTTPLGTYALPFSFGSHSRQAEWDLAYKKYDGYDYWVGDNRSSFYNRYRDRRDGGFTWRDTTSKANASERLASFPRQYEMSIVIGYNYDEPVRHRGTGIFLHVNGGGATAGCVSAPRAFRLATMDRLDPDLHPVISIGR
jgi:L,D-peptidoglycan transpeptidase YkuD (ErfK/YbiS/YcfS/YnhG family)